jgi:hypothetical protein
MTRSARQNPLAALLQRIEVLERQVAASQAQTALRETAQRITVRQAAHGFTRFTYVVMAGGGWQRATPQVLLSCSGTSGVVTDVLSPNACVVQVAGAISTSGLTADGISSQGVLAGDWLLSRRYPGMLFVGSPWNEIGDDEISITTDSVTGLTLFVPTSPQAIAMIGTPVLRVGRFESSGPATHGRCVLQRPEWVRPLGTYYPAGPRPGDADTIHRAAVKLDGYPVAELGTIDTHWRPDLVPIPASDRPGLPGLGNGSVTMSLGIDDTTGAITATPDNPFDIDFRQPVTVTVSQVSPLLVTAASLADGNWGDVLGATAYLRATLVTPTGETPATLTVGMELQATGWDRTPAVVHPTLLVRLSASATGYVAGEGIVITDNSDGTKTIAADSGSPSSGVTSIAMTANQGICHPDGTIAAKTGTITLGFLPFTKKGQIQYCDGNNPVNGTYPQIALNPTIGSQDVTAGAVLVLSAGIPAWTRDLVLGDASNQASFKAYLPGTTTLDLTGTPGATGKTLTLREIDVCDGGTAKKMLILASAPY